MMLYRQAEQKSQKIGEIQKLLKSVSVDCLLNQSQNDFIDMKKIKIELANQMTIDYDLRDNYSSICDYGLCGHECINKPNEEDDINSYSYTLQHLQSKSQNRIIKHIKRLFLKVMYIKKDIIDSIQTKRDSIDDIHFALTYLIENKDEFLIDKYLRKGNLVNIKDIYLFQPLYIDSYLSLEERSKPFEKRTQKIMMEIPKKEKTISQDMSQKSQMVQNTLDYIRSTFDHGMVIQKYERTETDFYNIYSKIQQVQTIIPEINITETQEKHFYYIVY